MTTPAIRPWNDSFIVDHPETETIAVWGSLWQAEFHMDLLENGVSPSHAVAQTMTNGEQPHEAF